MGRLADGLGCWAPLSLKSTAISELLHLTEAEKGWPLAKPAASSWSIAAFADAVVDVGAATWVTGKRDRGPGNGKGVN